MIAPLHKRTVPRALPPLDGWREAIAGRDLTRGLSSEKLASIKRTAYLKPYIRLNLQKLHSMVVQLDEDAIFRGEFPDLNHHGRCLDPDLFYFGEKKGGNVPVFRETELCPHGSTVYNWVPPRKW
jgi:hypothetical protein